LCRFPASLRWSVRRSSRPDPGPCGTGQSRSFLGAFDGIEHDLHTVSLGQVLVHLPLQSQPPCRLPRKASALPEAEPLFRAHHRPRQRYGSYFELARPPVVRLAAITEHEQRYVRPTSASHCFDYEYPTLRALPASFRDLRLAHDPELAPVAKRPVGLALHYA